jgi:hypothetical protein
MSEATAPANVIDELWSLAQDNRWHGQRALARMSDFNAEVVWAALGFLVKYGFAQVSGDGKRRIRITAGPSPRQVASILRGLVPGSDS